VNVDARLIKNGAARLSRVDEQLVELSNGCICCTLREDLLREVRNLARRGKFDYLLIESTGISEPLPVAETFTFTDEEGESLSRVARLDTLVTVVDAVNFGTDFESIEDLRQRGVAINDEDDRELVQLLVDQIEFANVLVISKCDLVDGQRLGELESLLRLLNPTAQVVRSTRGNVPLRDILDTQRFSEDWAADHENWLSVPRGSETSETEEYGFCSFVFEARRPFHPGRLMDFVSGNAFAGIARSKGLVWLATRNDHAGEWSQAGNVFSLHSAGLWAAAVPRDEWPDDPELVCEIESISLPPWGDRRTELVIIGRRLDQARVAAALESCLLTNDELSAGPNEWSVWDDPFVAWQDDESTTATEQPSPEAVA